MSNKTLQDFKNQVQSEKQEMGVMEDVINFISTALYITYLEQQLIEADEKQSEAELIWISVQDKMPEFDGDYLCYVEQEQNCKNVWKYCSVKTCSFNTFIVLHNEVVTHWMKLPNNPYKQDNNKEVKS